MLLGDGHGGFAPHVDYPTAASPVAVALADLDGDHRPDVATADADRKAVSVLLDRGERDAGAEGRLQHRLRPGRRGGRRPESRRPRRPRHREHLRLGLGAAEPRQGHASGRGPTTRPAARRTRSRSPTSTATASSTPPSPAARARHGRHLTVLLGRGDGTFRLRRYFGARVYASRLASGDLNGDGSPDLVFSDGGALAVMLNRGDATFQAPLWFGLADTLAVADFNGDGRLDLAGAWVDAATAPGA